MLVRLPLAVLLIAFVAVAAAAPAAPAAPLVRAEGGWAARVVDRGDGSACLQAGQVRRGRLGRVFFDGAFRAHRAREFSICGARARGARTRATLVRTALDRPGGRRARRVAVLVGGLAGRGAVEADVSSGPGLRRRVRIRPDGAWLLVLPRRAEQARLRIVVRYRGGRRPEVSDAGRGGRRSTVLPGSARIELRQADPVSRETLGLLVWRTTVGATCHAPGAVVDGQVGQVTRSGAGEFFQYPIADGGSCADLGRAFRAGGEPLALSIGGEFGGGRASVRVVGFARPDVTGLVVRGLGPAPVRVPISARSRAFLTAAALPAGAQEVPPVSIDVTFADGRVETRTYGGPSAGPGA